MHLLLLFCALAALGGAHAKTVVITVGGNTTDNVGKVFQPESVVAANGDVVLFNFTFGNHSATQSTFASPCIPAHDTDVTINGFDSSFRDAGNGTAITNLPFTVTDFNTTIWFFDYNTCAGGGVGGINIKENSSETLDGFKRNALRLNGSDPSASSSIPPKTSTATGADSTATKVSNNTQRSFVWSALAVIPLAILAICL